MMLYITVASAIALWRMSGDKTQKSPNSGLEWAILRLFVG
jgi:hypothetical protein